jgi:anti-sigma B factor antagonist
MSLQIDVTDVGGNPVIAVGGEVDLYSSPELREAISKATPGAKELLAIDLSQVPFMDSSGVATLVEGLRSTQASNKAFVLVAPSQSVMKVLQLSRLDSVFDIKDSVG